MTSIIIVTYNSSKTIATLLQSIADNCVSATYEVIIIDNNSSDNTAAEIQNFTWARFLPQKKNRGFAAACRIGVEQASGEHLLFLNPDTKLTEDCITPVLPLLGAKDSGVVGVQIRNKDGSVQASVRSFPTLLSQFMILLKLHHLKIQFSPLKRYFLPDFDYQREQSVDQVMGAAFFTKKRVWKELGGFDTKFFIWFEEVDFCFQAKRHGYQVIYTPRVSIQHVQGHSFSQVNFLKKQYWYISSMLKYFIKNGV